MFLHAIVNRNIRAPLQSLGLEIATAIDLDDGELPAGKTLRATRIKAALGRTKSYALPSLPFR